MTNHENLMIKMHNNDKNIIKNNEIIKSTNIEKLKNMLQKRFYL